jgi:hypothetical protein
VRSIALLVTLALLATGCGRSGRPSPEDGGMRVVQTKTPDPLERRPSEERGAVAGLEETRARVLVEKLAERLERARDPEVLTGELQKIREAGGVARELFSPITRFLKHRESYVRAAALEALAAIDPEQSRSFLIHGLDDSDPEVRQRSAGAWVIAGLRDLTPLLARLDRETDSRVQMAVLLVVEKLGGDEHVEPVGKLAEFLEPGVAIPALRFLVARKAVQFIPTILEMLRWQDGGLRAEAARGLLELGAKTKPVLLALCRGLLDDQASVARACHEALRGLTGQDWAFEALAEEGPKAAMVRTWTEWVEKNVP